MNSFIPSFLLSSLGPIILCALLLGAAWNDRRTFRIPNRLVAFGIGAGLFVNMILPAAGEIPDAASGALGLWRALQGMGVGFALLLPFYLMRALGAGDVKLMAMVGAFLGPGPLINIIFISFMLGGFLSIGLALKKRKLMLLMTNMQTMLIAIYLNLVLRKMGEMEVPAESVGTLPYAFAITGGTFLYLATANSVALQHFIPF